LHPAGARPNLSRPAIGQRLRARERRHTSVPDDVPERPKGTQARAAVARLATLANGTQPAASLALVRLCVEHLPRLLAA
jgi:hypothetical protein